MTKILLRLSMAVLLLSQAAQAAVELVTPDGRRVLLHDDHTWEYLSAEQPQQPAETQQDQTPRAVLQVSHVNELEGVGCRMGVVLQNDLPYKIKNLAIRFAVHKSESLPYDSVTRSFSEIKPTDNQYRRLLFRGIRCSEIHHIQIQDPGRCAMGDLDRFSAQPGDCIEHIRIEPTQLVNILK